MWKETYSWAEPCGCCCFHWVINWRYWDCHWEVACASHLISEAGPFWWAVIISSYHHFAMLYLVIHIFFFVDSLWQKGKKRLQWSDLYVHEDLIEGYSLVQCKHRHDRVWIKVTKSINWLARDLYIGFFYVFSWGVHWI